MREPIAIVGTGCRFAGQSTSPSRLWDLLKQPRDVQREIPTERFSVDGFYHENHAHHGTSNVRHSYLLDENVRQFDAQFFGMKPVEANAVDPQQRILLEVTFEALEAGGHSMSALQGSDTAVYVGVMCGDYESQLVRDTENVPTYSATGTARSILSSRLSYFFDWRGPSLTIDTACSSSLIAVHQAVQVLREGTSRLALAAGANLILGPENFISESKLKMLSPTGRSRMWDSEADGYARGEGVAAVVLKRLSNAISDGDHIECIIRETGINQDGRTNGITMPGVRTQAQLIRDVYRRAGLDPCKTADRPQYYEAHGTGTPAGDPVEAEAIHTAFFKPDKGSTAVETGNPIYVGSIKTVLGHTEGTAGLAAMIKGSLALQHGIIPPNMLFNKLNANIESFYGSLEIPTQATAWPELPPGQARRVSCGSFGFGGANAHAILESYLPAEPPSNASEALSEPYDIPFLFSAKSRRSLVMVLAAYSDYLKNNAMTNLKDLAWTLYARRSSLPVRVSLNACDTEELINKLDAATALSRNDNLSEAISVPRPKILGVFTGQGAQWAGMGRELLETSAFAASRMHYLDSQLQRLPPSRKPSWSLYRKLVDKEDIKAAVLSQPLCTAVQIIMVDLLRIAGVEFHAVVGHSSGEIAAAYAAGLISAEDACRVSYYRGMHASLASGSGGCAGKMMAAATSLQDAQELCALPHFRNRLCVAANNGPNSVTISGDEDAILEAQTVFEDEEKTAKVLFVDKAYHSHHMAKPAVEYEKDLSSFKPAFVSVDRAISAWFSSVYAEPASRLKDKLNEAYWNDNMIGAVRFYDAVSKAHTEAGPFDAAIEVGPHPALKRPTLDSLREVSGTAHDIPYIGVLSRGHNDVRSFTSALGSLWTRLGTYSLDFKSHEESLFGTRKRTLVTDLPTYSWDKEREYWHESRINKAQRTRKESPHALLGVRVSGPEEGDEYRWRNLLSVQEVPWLGGHRLQDQMIFPATGYCVMALEASRVLIGARAAKVIELRDVLIKSPLIFREDDTRVETFFTLKNIVSSSLDVIEAQWSMYSSQATHGDDLVLKGTGSIRITLGPPSSSVLSSRVDPQLPMSEIDAEQFYASLATVGYQYSGRFKALGNLRRRAARATGTILNPAQSGTDGFLAHPAALDAAIQAVLLALCYPNDGRLFSTYVPTAITSLKINVELCKEAFSKETLIPFDGTLLKGEPRLLGDVDLFTSSGEHAIVHLEGVECVLFAPATAADDTKVYVTTAWGPLEPDCASVCRDLQPTTWEDELAMDLERVCLYHLNFWEREIPQNHPARTKGSFRGLFRYSSHVRQSVASGRHLYASSEWMNDSHEDIDAIVSKHGDVEDMRLIRRIGQTMMDTIAGITTSRDQLMSDGLLDRYESCQLGLPPYMVYASRVLQQISHRYPAMNVLEIFGGMGCTTQHVLEQIGGAFGSYTFTDLTSDRFDMVQEKLSSFTAKMSFRVLDVDQDLTTQGFKQNMWDVVVVSFATRTAAGLAKSLHYLRTLLKPGGYIVILDVTDTELIRTGFIKGSVQSWPMEDGGGNECPLFLDTVGWDSVLQESGFSGVFSATDERDGPAHPFSVMVSQACDDRINLLREPLVEISSYSQNHIGNKLLIVGGSSLLTSRTTKSIEPYLKPYYGSVKVRKSLTDVETSDVTAETTVLALSDLDRPVFVDLTEESWVGLKAIFENAKCIVWLTSGSQGEDPYATMSFGFARSILCENPGLALQLIDTCGATLRADDISNALLRFSIASEWTTKNQMQDLTYSLELELRASETGCTSIPRVKAENAQNGRFNSVRRRVTETVDVSHHCIRAVEEHGSLVLEMGFPIQLVAGLTQTSLTTLVDVQYSSTRPLRLGRGSALFICIGSDRSSGKIVVVVSDIAGSSVEARREAVIPLNVDGVELAKMLHAICSQVICAQILATSRAGDHLIVHEPPLGVAYALADRASESGVGITLTTLCNRGSIPELSWAELPPNCHQRHLSKLVPRNCTKFINMATEPDGVAAGVALEKCLPSHCSRHDTTHFSCQTAYQSPHDDDESLQRLLNVVVKNSAAERLDQNTALVSVNKYPVDQVANMSNVPHLASIFDWTSLRHSAKAQAVVRKASSKPLFSAGKSYWLLGLSGDLGLSIAEFMARGGAESIVLSSRSPRIDANWISTMKDLGCEIHVFACDMTDIASLRKVFGDITQSLPRLAGIVQGAVVFRDTAIRDMDLDTMNTVLAPKVQANVNLDRILGNQQLDFLVYFSSLTAVTGNMGQSNYSAANSFMVGLAKQQRQRGIPASVINLGAVMGVGYISRADINQEVMIQGGFEFHSETAVHEIFCEAVSAAQKDSGLDPEITTGLRHVGSSEERVPFWFNNPRFSHLIVHETDDADGAKKGAAIPLRTQLEGATTKGEVFKIIQAGFLARLQQLLKMDFEDDRTEDEVLGLRTDSIGIDSLIAVEIRTWFLKNLQVNVPVLKILGGASLGEIIHHALGELPRSLIPGLDGVGAEGPQQTPKPLVVSDQAPTASSVIEKDSSSVGLVSRDSGSSIEDPSSFDEQDSSLASVSTEVCTPSEVSNVPVSRRGGVQRSGPLSHCQSMFWVVNNLVEDRTTLNSTGLLRLRGKFQVGELARAVEQVGARHESLRTSIDNTTDGFGVPMQKVLTASTLHLETVQVTAEEDISKAFEALHNHIYDLKNGQIMRIMLLTMSSDDHYLLMGAHHLNADGHTHQVLMRDIEGTYNQETLPPPIQYLDYAIRQREQLLNGSFSNDLKFWADVLDAIPDTLPILPLPDARPRKVLDDYAFHRVKFRLNNHINLSIKNASRKSNVTPFQFHLSAFRALLHLLGGTDHFAVGIADANRTPSEILGGVGPYMNLLPLVFSHHPGQDTFASILRDTREKVLGALAHSRIPFGAVLESLSVERSEYHTPIFQTFVDYREGIKEKDTFCGAQLEVVDFRACRTAYDINVDIINFTNGTCQVEFMVQASIYSKRDMELFAGAYEQLLQSCVVDPSQVLAEYQLFDRGSVAEALRLGRGPAIDSKWPQTVVHRVVEVATSNPTSTAVKDSYGTLLTYRELLLRVKSIAEALGSLDCTVGSVVGVFQRRASDWVASMLAAMYVGGVYLPLDPALPSERLQALVADCAPSVIIADTTNVKRAGALVSKVLNVSAVPPSPSNTNIRINAEQDCAGVIFYTSGTTSFPKGIRISHRSLCNEAEMSAQSYGFGVERVFQQSAPSFDMSLTQTFAALCFGGFLYVCPLELHADPSAQASLMASEQITLTGGTPSEYLGWINAGFEDLSHSPWNYAICGGEPIKPSLLHAFRSLQHTNLRLFNAYGPTEVTCSVTRHRVDYDNLDVLQAGPLTAGMAAPNAYYYIANARQKALPVGFTGEIIVGGAGVAMGYLNNENETADKFWAVKNCEYEDVPQAWTREYRTGDVGKMMPDGSLLVLGRIGGDAQVKLRGIRMELGDIEHEISKIAGIEDVVVCKRTIGSEGLDFLVAHVTVSDERLKSSDRLNDAIDSLPLSRYMRPALVVATDHLPKGQTGKVDRNAVTKWPLPMTPGYAQTGDSALNTDTDSELEQMRLLWASVIIPEAFSQHTISGASDFFHVGGNSLLLVKLQQNIKDAYHVHVSLVQLFESSTLSRMTRLVNDQAEVQETEIDWEKETRPPKMLATTISNVHDSEPAADVVVLTGATGHLGRELLKQLDENSNIKEVYCIAVRGAKRLGNMSAKARVYEGDLGQPRLGLSPADASFVFSKATVVIHNGANVSHMKHYRSLRADNVTSIRELLLLVSPRGLPLHFVSTAGVALYRATPADDSQLTFGEVSVADFPPPTTGIDGYNSSKWAGERLLERAHAQTGLPVFIHRPSNIARPDVPSLDLFRNLLQFSSRMGIVPVSEKLRGVLNLVGVEECARGILSDVPSSSNVGTPIQHEGVQYRHQIGDVNLTFEDLQSYVAKSSGRSEEEITVVPLTRWAELAVEAGLQPAVASFFTAAESGGDVHYPLLFKE
ncbi:polyketide synthetase [Xylariaceae sp. FL1019]|nr:polyketide synthetase [Xylariaceae sp. FL1019]